MRLIDADKLETHEIFDGVEWNVIVYKDDIDAQPTIDAELVKHGMWIGKPMIGGYSRMRCSVCDNVFLENKEKWNYCPYCGARMENDV